MKRLFRSNPVQDALAFLLAGYLRVTLASMRWRWVDRALAEQGGLYARLAKSQNLEAEAA